VTSERADPPVDLLRAVRELRERAAVFLDFDGTLAEIAATPDLARPSTDGAETLARLSDDYALVAVVSGRPASQVRARLDIPKLVIFGLYGLDPETAQNESQFESSSLDQRSGARAALADVESAIADIPEARLEDKGRSVAIHYRGARDPGLVEALLLPRVAAIAEHRGLAVVPGKMVLELAPLDTPGKGSVVLREVRARGLSACLFAGDDLADLRAFQALDELRAEGVHTAKVAVRGPETPARLIEASDVVVEGPPALVGLLRGLLPEPGADG
jgi:trehalose 6-phosphate phosphatase